MPVSRKKGKDKRMRDRDNCMLIVKKHIFGLNLLRQIQGHIFAVTGKGAMNNGYNGGTIRKAIRDNGS